MSDESIFPNRFVSSVRSNCVRILRSFGGACVCQLWVAWEAYSRTRDENLPLRNASEQFRGSETTEPAWLPMDFGISERFADSLLRGFVRESRSSFSLCTHGAPLPTPPPPSPATFSTSSFPLVRNLSLTLTVSSYISSVSLAVPCRRRTNRIPPWSTCVLNFVHTEDRIHGALNRVHAQHIFLKFFPTYPLQVSSHFSILSNFNKYSERRPTCGSQLCDSMIQVIPTMLHISTQNYFLLIRWKALFSMLCNFGSIDSLVIKQLSFLSVWYFFWYLQLEENARI